MDKLILEIVTPHGPVFGEEVEEVSASGSEGEFGVLPGHASFITTLKIGMLAARKGKDLVYFFINWGYAEVGLDKIHILADSAERAEDIDVARAMAAKQRAEERLKKAEEIDFTRASAALQRAILRMQVAEKKPSR